MIWSSRGILKLWSCGQWHWHIPCDLVRNAHSWALPWLMESECLWGQNIRNLSLSILQVILEHLKVWQPVVWYMHSLTIKKQFIIIIITITIICCNSSNISIRGSKIFFCNYSMHMQNKLEMQSGSCHDMIKETHA